MTTQSAAHSTWRSAIQEIGALLDELVPPVPALPSGTPTPDEIVAGIRTFLETAQNSSGGYGLSAAAIKAATAYFTTLVKVTAPYRPTAPSTPLADRLVEAKQRTDLSAGTQELLRRLFLPQEPRFYVDAYYANAPGEGKTYGDIEKDFTAALAALAVML